MALWSPELRGSERSFSRSLLFDSGVWSSLHGEATFLNFADSVCFVCYLLGFIFLFLISEERNINPAQPHHVVIYCGLFIIVINLKFFNTTLPNFLFSKYSILLERSFFFSPRVKRWHLCSQVLIKTCWSCFILASGFKKAAMNDSIIIFLILYR